MGFDPGEVPVGDSAALPAPGHADTVTPGAGGPCYYGAIVEDFARVVEVVVVMGVGTSRSG